MTIISMARHTSIFASNLAHERHPGDPAHLMPENEPELHNSGNIMAPACGSSKKFLSGNTSKLCTGNTYSHHFYPFERAE